jgi:hypothetical protein
LQYTKTVKFKKPEYEKIYFFICLLAPSFSSASVETESQKAINQVGYPCQKVTQVFRNGVYKDSKGLEQLHISIACSGGENYLLSVPKGGDVKVIPCGTIDKLAGGREKRGSCFTNY